MKKEITLLIDADDTLWENNIFFEKAIAEYLTALENIDFTAGEIEPVLRKREMENVKIHGYGSNSLAETFREVYFELCEMRKVQVTARILECIEEARQLTRNYEIQLLKGVAETLPRFKKHFILFIVTKGFEDEQLAKIRRCGVDHHFEKFIVVPEKNVQTYENLIKAHKLIPHKCWMIGNSPRSDINPAKMAGLNTALIPYHSTWDHEKAEILDQEPDTIIASDFFHLFELLSKYYGHT
ncbi:MAG: HAD family hydrolase [Vulcanimicrobiota bacterium]